MNDDLRAAHEAAHPPLVPRFPYTERPAEQEFAVVVAALLAGRIDGQQAIASLTALHERMAAARLAERREQIAARFDAMDRRYKDAGWVGAVTDFAAAARIVRGGTS